MLELSCSKCGESADRLLLKSLLIEFGCRASSDPSVCDDGESHDFVKPEQKNNAQVGGER